MTYANYHRPKPPVTDGHVGILAFCAVIGLVLWGATGGSIAAFVTAWSAVGCLLALKDHD